MSTWIPVVKTSLDLPKESLRREEREEEENSYVKKVVKYIPGEITAFYIGVTALLKTSEKIPLGTWLWVVAGVLFFLSPVWIFIAAAEDKKEDILHPKPSTIFRAVVAPLAFACWVLALGGPFENPPINFYLYGSLLAAFVSFIVPAIEKLLTYLKKL